MILTLEYRMVQLVHKTRFWKSVILTLEYGMVQTCSWFIKLGFHRHFMSNVICFRCSDVLICMFFINISKDKHRSLCLSYTAQFHFDNGH